MSEVMIRLINTSVICSVLILIIFLLRFIFKEKINTKLQYTLWIIVAVRLLIPFNYQWEIESKNIMPQVEVIDFRLQNNVGQYKGDINESAINRDMESDISTWNSKSKHYVGNLSEGLFIVWIAGVISVLGVFIIRNILFYKQIKKGMTPYSLPYNAYDEARQIVGLKQRVPIYLSQNLTSPCVIGIFNSVIVLTDRVIYDAGATKYALIHEMIHYKHKDNLIRLLGNILCALYWFNPLIWLAAEAARNDAELCCDSRVLKKISSKEHYNYCITLLSAVSKSNGMVTAMSAGGKKMKKRIDMILKPPQNKTIATFVAVVCLVLGIASFININVKAQGSITKPLAENSGGENHTEIISLGNIHEVYDLLISLPNPNHNYKINTIIINNEDYFKNLYLGYEFSKSDSVGGLEQEDLRRINRNVLQLFSSIPDLKTVRISYIDKLANSVIPNVKAPITYNYERSEIESQYGDLSIGGGSIENFNITPQIDESFWRSMGKNNSLLIYGYSEILSTVGIEKEEYIEDSNIVNKLFSTLGQYDDTWKSHNSTVYKFSPNPVYSDWSNLMIFTDESGNFRGHGIVLGD